MSGPSEGTYLLHYGPQPIGGEYAAREHGSNHITLLPLYPGNQLEWKLVKDPEEEDTYLILIPDPKIFVGFHNTSNDENQPIILGQPKKFRIESVGKDNLYTIQVAEGVPLGVNVYVGVDEKIVVTKPIPVIRDPPQPPVWRLDKRH